MKDEIISAKLQVEKKSFQLGKTDIQVWTSYIEPRKNYERKSKGRGQRKNDSSDICPNVLLGS